MKRNLQRITFAMIGVFLGVLPVLAQERKQDKSEDGLDDVPEVIRYWSATLPGGTFNVKLDSIDSVSVHEYLVPQGGRVTELAVTVQGSVYGRFYYVEAAAPDSPSVVGQSVINSLVEKAHAVTERVGADEIWTQVIKDYPAATHAHTVEYRLATREDVERLFRSVDRAWKRNRTRSVTVK